MPSEGHNRSVTGESGGTWAGPEGSRSDRCAGCGGVLTLTRLQRQPMPEDHARGCRQYSMALRVMQFAADLAHAAPEPDEDAAGPYGLGWQLYCREAVHDLESAARAVSVSDALKQQQGRYAADTQTDGTDGGRGRAAAATMLTRACQALSQSKKPDPVITNSMSEGRRSDRAWRRRLPWGRQQ